MADEASRKTRAEQVDAILNKPGMRWTKEEKALVREAITESLQEAR